MNKRQQSLRVTNLIKSGLTRPSINRIIRKEKIKISRKDFDKKFKKFSTREVLVKRFNNARMTTKITIKYFKKVKNPNRSINNYVVTFVAKVTNNKTGFSEETFLSVGYDKVINKIKIFELIDEVLKQFVKDSPNISVEFIRIHALTSKRGLF